MARTELASRQISSDWMAARDELLAQPALRW
jgi:hypothetical protein